MRDRVKQTLRSLGLLGAAVRVRDLARVVRAFPRNARYRRRGSPDGLPLPPGRLVYLVAGTADLQWYVDSGTDAAESIRETLARNGLEIEGFSSLLDFGCGCGRVIRRWTRLGAEVRGSDLNPELVGWCRQHLRFGRFELNGLRPPLAFADGQFDLVYALSVFTHLPEQLQRPWIAELRRVLQPGGCLLISVHGAPYRDALSAEERRRFEMGELVVREEGEAGGNRCGAYHPPAYVWGTLAEGFAVVEFVPEGATGNAQQDLWLLRKL